MDTSELESHAEEIAENTEDENNEEKPELCVRHNGEVRDLKAKELEDVFRLVPLEADVNICEYCFEKINAKATVCRHCHHAVNRKTTEDGDKVSFTKEEVTTEVHGWKQVSQKVLIHVKDETILRMLRTDYDMGVDSLYSSNPFLSMDDCLPYINSWRECIGNYMKPSDFPLYPIVEFITKEIEEHEKRFEGLKEKGMVCFDMLRYLFTKGVKITGFIDGKYKVGSQVQMGEYVQTACGQVYAISGEVIKSNGDSFYSDMATFSIPSFRGAKEINKLSVQPMSAEDEAFLTERGEKFSKVAVGAHFRAYQGPMIYRTSQYKVMWNAEGRIMLDCSSFLMTNPGYSQYTSQNSQHMNFSYRANRFHNSNQVNDKENRALDETKFYKCWHTVGGFSFLSKKWGEILIEHVSDIKFDSSAFGQLVLPEDKKGLIHALVRNSQSGFSDIIAGKGNGCIFLLHGPPGTGKTLTAEAVAEMLERPLYSVSCGELGVKTAELEKSLKELLDVASVWNAVVLIDEADIFLEKRRGNDIQRNAMVGIFLRLLEYHQGIMFLTTNRVTSFDEAFHSRISVALRYPALEQSSRLQVWKNLLLAAKIQKEANKDDPQAMACADLDVNTLSQYDLNGRQIRTTIRLAQAISAHNSEPLTMDHFERNIRIAAQFLNDLRSSVNLEDI